MKRALLATAASLLLAGCATGGYDAHGNETFAFGTQTDTPAGPGKVIHYAANNRDQLASWCHDNRGFLSGDGQNCVVTIALTDKRWCVQAVARGDGADYPWMNAICNEARPSILPGLRDVLG